MGVLDIIQDNTLTFQQVVNNLAKEAENSIDPIKRTAKVNQLIEAGIICTLNEGNAPFRPRYVMVDFEKFQKQGSKFLNLKPATNIFEATNNLLILYRHVPSVTTFPVYLGNLDTLLEPYIEDEAQARLAIRLFLENIDRTLTDSFVHANIGPKATRAGYIIMELMEEMQLAVPNLTMKVNQDDLDEAFVKRGIDCALKVSKPSFANDNIYGEDFKSSGYGIASCYNGLPIAGGGYTLMRLRLFSLAKQFNNLEDFYQELDVVVKEMCEFMSARIKFLVEETNFMKSNFLVTEGLVDADLFAGMFGVVGLAECTNHFSSKKYGHDQEANELALEIVKRVHRVVNSHQDPYTKINDGHHLLHAQVGIETDKGQSPGCRIPVGQEPSLLEHIVQSSPFHEYFKSGIGDIFVFNQQHRENPAFIYDALMGGFRNKLRYMSVYSEDCDVVRVTGYLVKRSEIEKLNRNEQSLNESTILGKLAGEHAKALSRKIR